MSAEKEKIEDLAKKVDELLSVLNVISSDLSEVSKSLKKISGTKATITPAVSTPSLGKTRSINDVKQGFSPELVGMLFFEEIENYIIVKPRRFLGSDNFAQIAAIVRDLGGEYISAGKNSHFKIPK
ncbi:MAG: hypothetical protein P8Y18_04525 [Candidatus Bathyarchaeota archaeon]